MMVFLQHFFIETLVIKVLVLLVAVLLQGTCLNINNLGSSSYAVYPQWISNLSDNKLQLRFKTNENNGMLLVINDGDKNKNELKVSLRGGSIHLYFKMGSEDMLSVKEIDLGSQWNDMEWHALSLQQKFREVLIQVDQYKYNLGTDGKDDWLKLTSMLFIGGNPYSNYEGFTGCIDNLVYQTKSTLKTPVKAVGNVLQNCKDKCSKIESTRCQHNGKCSKIFDDSKFECDCAGTGYKGTFCSLKEPTGYFTESTIIIRSMDSLSSFQTNKVQLRLRTVQSSGIIMFTQHASNYMLIEMHHGKVVLKSTFGADDVNLISKREYNDGRWHSIIVRRRGFNVSLNVDHGKDTQSSLLLYQPLELCTVQKQKVFVGGYLEPQFLAKSNSKSNFIGCLQQVHFQEDKVELLTHAAIKNDIYTQINGADIQMWECPVENKFIGEEVLVTSPVKDDKEIKKQTKLDHKTVAWLTGGICIGAICLVMCIAFAFSCTRKRYSGRFKTKFLSTNEKSYGTAKVPSSEFNFDLNDKRRYSSKRDNSIVHL